MVLSSLSCDLRIIQAKNIDLLKTTGNLFVRYYLPTGDGKRVSLDTREIAAKSANIWNDSISLECNASNTFVEDIVAFELRRRSTVPVFGKIKGSKLVGRAEVPWKEVFESPNMVLNKWITMVPRRTTLEGKPVKLQLSIKVGLLAGGGMEKRKPRRVSNWDECGCNDGHGYGCSCSDYEIFALAALLESV